MSENQKQPPKPNDQLSREELIGKVVLLEAANENLRRRVDAHEKERLETYMRFVDLSTRHAYLESQFDLAKKEIEAMDRRITFLARDRQGLTTAIKVLVRDADRESGRATPQPTPAGMVLGHQTT